MQSSVLRDDQAGGLWVAVFDIDRVLQFFYIIKHRINSFIIVHFILCFQRAFVKSGLDKRICRQTHTLLLNNAVNSCIIKQYWLHIVVKYGHMEVLRV